MDISPLVSANITLGTQIFSASTALLVVALSADTWVTTIGRWPASVRRQWFKPAAIAAHESHHPRQPSLRRVGAIALATAAAALVIVTVLPSASRQPGPLAILVPLALVLIAAAVSLLGELKQTTSADVTVGVLTGSTVGLMALGLRSGLLGAGPLTVLPALAVLAAASIQALRTYRGAWNQVRSTTLLTTLIVWLTLYS